MRLPAIPADISPFEAGPATNASIVVIAWVVVKIKHALNSLWLVYRH
jgi:hypothetical protein